MENKIINIATVEEIATALSELTEEVVFVGGSIISLYTDDIAADEIRPTEDVDVMIELTNYMDLVKLQNRLTQLNFSPNPDGHALCNYIFNNIPVDIMPSEDGPLGQSNRWYKIGFDNLWVINLDSISIRVLSAPCFLATKFEAFNDRGKDYRTSRDFDDIIYVIDNRIEIVKEIDESESEIKQFLKQEFLKLAKNYSYEEYVSSHIHPLMLEERLNIVLDKIELISGSSE